MSKDDVLKLTSIEKLGIAVSDFIKEHNLMWSDALVLAWQEAEADYVDEMNKALAQPAQEPEPDELTIAYMSGLYDGKALAQPAQEPFAWAIQGCSNMWRGEFAEIDAKAEAKRIGGTCVAYALYTTPPQRPWVELPTQEPVATCERCADEIVASNAGLCANCLPAIFPVQEPVFKWHSVFQEMPVENSHLLFCFGVHVVEGSYTKNGWASLSYGSAQPDFWAYFPPPPNHKRNQELYAMPQPRPWVDEEAVRADEREACAKVVIDIAKDESSIALVLEAVADAIRARGNT